MNTTTITRALGPVLAGLSLVGLAACGGGYDRQGAIDDLVEGGFTTEQATCMMTELEASIGEDRLGERSFTGSAELTAEEETAVSNATLKCIIGS
ncbi:MAG: hypothetical protein R2761_29480 [Acidimicrobiales bacterium]